MTRKTYRAAGWVADDKQSDVRLTSESQKDLSDDDLIAAAEKEAEAVGIDLEGSEILIGDWTE